MGSRAELQTLLLTLCNNVYFQPPETVKMSYPCIVYRRDREDAKFSGNKPYSRTKRYLVTVIDPDPDSDIPDKVGALPMCTFDRFYTADDLNHDVYNIFF